MKHFTLFLLLFFTVPLFAQDCGCAANFEWVRSTFEENDAGYQFVIDQKGEAAYAQHNKTFAAKIATITDAGECTQAITDWLAFFRSGHLSVRSLAKESSGANTQQSNEDIMNSYKDWETVTVDLESFQQYLQQKETQDLEGIWVNGPYRIGIKKQGTGYVGFIIEADGVYWTEGQVKARINEDHSATYYMRDHSPQDFKEATLLGKKYLEMGFITLERVFPETEPEPEIANYFKAISADDPYAEQLDDQTMYVRIPRFWGSEKRKIDSVLQANEALILATPNLIIDLRNNGGGSDSSFQGLLPFLYTNPIRTVGVELLSTPLNNQRMLDFINKEEYGFNEQGKKWAQESYDKLSERLGEFVSLNEYPISVDRMDTIYKYPENIGIIINENNGSTTEQFLLAAKQSKKVKLFGTTTAGVLDISNMYFVPSPCGDLELGYSLSKSMRIPEMTIDDKGIQPDYYMDKEIKKYEWIPFVMEVLNEE